MRPDTSKIGFIGAAGTPSPTSPVFSGRAVIDAGSTEPSAYSGRPMPTTNAPDNREFREKLKAYLADKWGVDDAKFAELEDEKWKRIKAIENNIYFFGGVVEDNVIACACHLGFRIANAIKK